MNPSVWAPKASSVALRVNGQDHSMTGGGDGWWRSPGLNLAPGTDYQFVLNGEAVLPDPRSPWQPQGVHGPSRTLDDGDFAWSDESWQPPPLSSAIIYELHVGTFTPAGTFAGVAERLGYLKELGVTHVELMPVHEFSGDWGWGYDGVDLYAPHHAYGGPLELKRLVNACHRAGLAVILDVVYNHLGPSGNYLPQFGPYLTAKHSTPWGDAINLDGEGSSEVRRFLIDNALAWLRDYHFDGLRLDAVHALIDSSATHFLEQLSGEVKQLESALGKYKSLIAESDLNDPRIVIPREAGGYGLDAQWSDEFHHALHALLTGETSGYYEDFGRPEMLGKALRDVFVYDGAYSRHRGRNHGRPVENVSRGHFLGYIQTHDQVGNRAKGERISHLIGFERAKIAAAIYLTSPFIPMIFMGEEFGASSPFRYFTNHEPEIGRAVSEGRRREFSAFGWNPEDVPDPQSPETFLQSKLDWSELNSPPHHDLYTWYREIIQERKQNASLAAGMPLSLEQGDDWIAIRRTDIVVWCNFSEQEKRFPLEKPASLLASSRTPVSLSRSELIVPALAAVLVKESL